VEFGLLLVFVVVVVLLAAPLIALARTRKLKRESATREELAALTQRLYGLERSV
jgi:hypothetical protein